jgi:HK97 family phage portal protein
VPSRTKSRSWTATDFFGAQTESEATLDYIEEGYKENPYVYRAVKLMAQGVASLDLAVYDEDERREDHPAAELLRSPNPLDGKPQFVEHLATSLLIAGRTYVEAIGTDTGEPQELYVPEESDIKPNFSPQADGFIEQYRSDSAQETWSPEEMTMIRLVDPANPLQGQSIIQAAARVIDVSNYGRKYAHALLKSMGVPPYLMSMSGKMSEDQKSTFREDFAESVRESFRKMQAQGVTRPKVYDSMEDASIEQLGMDPSEMDLLDLMQQSGREIAVAMGPAPELLGDPENKVYNNVSQAREALYTEHVIPLGRLIAGQLTGWLLPKYNDGNSGLRIDFDEKDIEALKQDPQEQRKMDMEELKSGAITINEYRERQGLDPVDGGDVLLLPSNTTPTATDLEMPVNGTA